MSGSRVDQKGANGSSVAWILMGVVVAWVLIGSIVASFENNGDTQSDYSVDYPACGEIVGQPGTYNEAQCVHEDEVIDVDDHPDWNRPWE